jgi:hypothetical protein
MRTKILLLTLLLALFAMPVFAQENAPGTSVSFNGFAFEYRSFLGPNVNISWYPGDPLENGPVADASHSQFTLYEAFPVPESQWDAKGGIRVYGIDALAQYETLMLEVEHLKTLLDQQPDLSTFESADAERLPFVPPTMHGQAIRARAHYVETDAFKGISYVIATPIMDGYEPFLSDQFFYVFQGISADGNIYVSAVFHLETSLFPAEFPADFDIAAFQQQLPDYLRESISTLESAQPEDFSPSLNDLDSLIASFNLEG